MNRNQYEVPPRFRQKHQAAPSPIPQSSQQQQPAAANSDTDRQKSKPVRLTKRRGKDPPRLQQESDDVATNGTVIRDEEMDDDVVAIGSSADDDCVTEKSGSVNVSALNEGRERVNASNGATGTVKRPGESNSDARGAGDVQMTYTESGVAWGAREVDEEAGEDEGAASWSQAKSKRRVSRLGGSRNALSSHISILRLTGVERGRRRKDEGVD